MAYSAGHHTAESDPFAKLELKLRCGVVVLATLYPLLRRLETQGLLSSEWKIEDGPPRRQRNDVAFELRATGLR